MYQFVELGNAQVILIGKHIAGKCKQNEYENSPDQCR